ncbi:MAG: arginine decarboxylase, pyruvoyl-dependent [candidate division WOR-3 bacterium]|jgi:arginine decarboxylase|nr:arginine decarboxylase, pyruvoyl-dependent [candidate division WOR-3 bacterium]MCR4423632.1 arginine decarboxylase, pyruvoyl-dependent [candidate division WOR-3 bacterium]MDH7518971.1 arginine decarboxylase, pyruvoyl-dependent [bacterium]NPV13889.1 arginine decarboxylase, pyruvoyl-dependent [candidate division WOR-3 bacterium]
MVILPRYVFLTKGVGVHRERLASFEAALRDAGIAPFNLVRVSSIFPPYCRIISRTRGLNLLKPGQVLFVVISDNATNEPHRLIAASIGIAIPKDPSRYGYLSEYHSFGEREEKAGDYAEDLAAQMLATTLGVPFDPDLSYDKRKEVWKIAKEIVRTQNITQSAIGNKNGLWTTVVAAAVFVTDVPEDKETETESSAQPRG